MFSYVKPKQKFYVVTKVPVRTLSFIRSRTASAILSFGHPGNFVTTAIRLLRTEGMDPAHYDMRFVKPLDEQLLHEVFAGYRKIITIEDGTIVGGFGSAVLEFMNQHGYTSEIKILGIPDKIVEHGTPKELQSECGFDAQGIADAVRDLMKDKVRTGTFVTT